MIIAIQFDPSIFLTNLRNTLRQKIQLPAAPVVIPVMGIEIAPRIEFSVFRPVTVFFSGGRGPPAASSIS